MSNHKYNWSFLRKKYFSGNWKSNKEFAAAFNVNYNASFRKRVSGWKKLKQQKDAEKTEKIIEKTIEKQIEKEVDRNTKILEINDIALEAAKEYFENKDYKRCIVETTKPYLDKEGKPYLDGKGKAIMCKSVDIVDVPFVVIDKVKFGIDAINKANLTSRLNEGLDKPDNQKQEAPPINIIKDLEEGI